MLTLFLLQSQSWGCDTDMFEPNNSQTQIDSPASLEVKPTGSSTGTTPAQHSLNG